MPRCTNIRGTMLFPSTSLAARIEQADSRLLVQRQGFQLLYARAILVRTP
jgi:hypothetical protein